MNSRPQLGDAPLSRTPKEALQLYLERLTEDGIIAMHLSNRFLNLEVVVARLVQELREREPNLTALRQFDDTNRFDPQEDNSPTNYIPGKRASQWMVLARDAQYLSALESLPPTMSIDGRQVELSRWKDLSGVRNGPLWTDDFSNLAQILHWRSMLPWLDN